MAALLAATAIVGIWAGEPVVSAERSTKTAVEQKEIEPIDVNRADVEELARIPGIGETTAGRIVEFRKEHGPFRRVDDLLKVKGIGEKSLEKLRPYVKVGKAS